MLGPSVPKTRLQRAEHAVLALALALALAWVVFVAKWTDPWRALAWLIAPDLVLVPILLASRSRGGPAAKRGGDATAGASIGWPRWGAPLYNATHTYASMVPGWALGSLMNGHVVWPMLAWAVHIELDRALGFDLREG